MNGTKRAQSSATWTTPECPFAIKYAQLVLEDIRLATVAAFHRLSHGGLEIGGILVGSQSTDWVTITGFRMLPCEHAFGPTFRLSETDHDRLAAAIAEAQSAGETVVGWFHSHTRTGIFLSEADLEIHNRYFKDLRQVALVLKPSSLEPMLCGFFFREADGSIHSDKSYREFALECLNKNAGQARVAVPERDAHRMNVPEAPAPRHRPREDAALQQLPQELGAGLPPIDVRPSIEPAIDPPATQEPQQLESPGRRPLHRESGKWSTHWGLAVAGFSILVVIALGVAYLSFRRSGTGARAAKGQTAASGPSAAGQSLGLKLVRQGADLSLTWNRANPDVLGATAGLLIIKDGNLRKEKGLSIEQLRSANILFAPENENVEVQLALLLPNKRVVRESAIAILPAQGPLPPATAKPVATSSIAPSSPYSGQSAKSKTPNLGPRDALSGGPQPNPAPVQKSFDKTLGLKLAQPHPQTKPAPPVSPNPSARLPSGTPTAASGRTGASAPGTVAKVAPAVPTGQAVPDIPLSPMRDAGNAKSPVLIWRKNPVFPPAARASNLQGVVALECLIGKDGHVKSLTVISGLAVFRQAALDAVRQWMYRPTMVNGEVVDAPTRVEILFRKDM